MTALGLAFLVFLPSMITTPLAGKAARANGPGTACSVSLAIALLGLAMLLVPNLISIVAGMTLVGVGTFFAQAVATGHVGRIARGHKAAASGLYLSSYYCGGLAGAAVIGLLFDRFGWASAVGGVALALGLAAVLGLKLVRAEDGR
jgi:predicted MFS family arabinose efflux permease